MHYGVVAESDAAAKYLDRNTMGMKRVEGPLCRLYHRFVDVRDIQLDRW